jgi:fructuronate reductase
VTFAGALCYFFIVKLASINNLRRFVNSRPAGTRAAMFFSSRYLRYPVAAIAAACPVLYHEIFFMVVDRNQRCYTNCVRWLRHKAFSREFSPRMVDELHNNESHHGKHPLNRQRRCHLRSQRTDPRIVHLGFGAFHRAHQAVYADILASEHGSDWGYTEVNLIGGEQQIADLQQQICCIPSPKCPPTPGPRVVGVVKQALHAGVDGLEAVLAAMYVSHQGHCLLTLQGYCHSPLTATNCGFDRTLIAADLHNRTCQNRRRGSGGALSRRRAASLPCFTVMSCDNMPENGHVMRNVVCAYARALNEDLLPHG